MTSEQILAFVGFALVMAATPGPSNSLLTATAAQVGIVRGLPALLGVAVGMAALLFSVTLGLGALIQATPMILLFLRILGAAILAWLALQIARSSGSVHSLRSRDAAPIRSADVARPPRSGDAAPRRSADSAPPRLRDAAPRRLVDSVPLRLGDAAPPRAVGFATAAAFQWVNPKSWLAAASAAAFLTPSPLSAPLHAAVLAAIFVAVAIPSCFVWLAFGAVVHRILRSPGPQLTFNVAMAALLAISALTLLLT